MDPERLEALRRNSGLALTKEGVWAWGTGQVENPRVQAMFHSGVAVRADGEVTLTVGPMWAYITVEHTAFFVRSADFGDRQLRLLGDRRLDFSAIRAAGWGPDERLYLWFDGLSGPAICLRDVHQVLVTRLSEEGGLSLRLGGCDATDDRGVAVAMLSAIPAAGTPAPI